MTKIGVLHPYRSDPGLIEFIETNLHIDADLDIRGAQDGMTDEEIVGYSHGVEPNSHAETLEDGSTVYITREVVLEGMQRQTQAQLDAGCDGVMICCTLPWPELDALAGVVTPAEVLETTAVMLAPAGGTVGVIQPVADAADEEIQHWLALGEVHGLRIVSTVAAPELPGEEVLAGADDYRAAVASLLDEGADVIVMDCMAFTDEHRAIVAEAAGPIPVIQAMSLTGNLVAHAFG